MCGDFMAYLFTRDSYCFSCGKLLKEKCHCFHTKHYCTDCYDKRGAL